VTVGRPGHAGGKHRICCCVHVYLDVTPWAEGAASLFLASLLDRESVDFKWEPTVRVMRKIRTELLEIAFEEGGPKDGPAVMILHGWPDAPCGWDSIASRLQAEGWRTVIPYLRGSGPTSFLSEETPRVGSGVALAQDAIDLADALGLGRFAVVGHDWGARAAYTLAALFPERISSVSALALGYQPGGFFKVPSFEQSKRFWYQWFLCVDGGAEKVREDPVGFARIQWETWSPEGWFDEVEFAKTAESFSNPDWVSITLNAYRARWRDDEVRDSRYEDGQRRLEKVELISAPTLMIQGVDDCCDPPSESEGLERYFAGGYHRLLLEGVGHFPHREAPDIVADLIVNHLREKGSR
jgi:pimeloyl-ACP methyl ester carboxylesterase